MRRLERSVLVIAGGAAIALGFSIYNANASGFDNTGLNSIDLLFDPAKFATEISYTYVFRNVEYEAKNPRTYLISAAGSPVLINPITTGNTKESALPDVWNYMFRTKVSITDNLSCMARTYNPGTILEEVSDDWAGRFTLVKTELQTLGIDGICGAKLTVRDGHNFWLYGGGRYVEADLNVLKGVSLGPAITQADVALSGSGFGWNAGIAYEIPEFAIRASLSYESAIDLDATGSFQTGAVNLGGPITTFIGSASAELPMPQAIELNLQTGIAPKWLATFGVKWVDWSVLDKLTVNNDISGSPIQNPGPGNPNQLPPGSFINSERYFNFEDGWTVSLGIGHQLTEEIQVGSSVTWDKGIGGPYSDTYQWALGGAWQINENVKWSLGGALVYKTADKDVSRNRSGLGGPDPNTGNPTLIESGDDFDLHYDSSFQFGISTKLKLTF